MTDDKRIAAAVDKLVSRMRDVIDELAPEARERVLTSIRAVSGEIADRLEAPLGRSH